MKDLASLYLRRNGDATLVAQALALAVTKQAMKPTPEQQAMRDRVNEQGEKIRRRKHHD
uniref:Uncharacterized protein n=1 Tax=viral metagenome TaxID=1070528 RepID=A0A6M3J1T8_9ZZZZ